MLVDIFLLLTTPPGNLAYHLVLIFSILLAGMAAFGYWRHTRSREALRTVAGLFFLGVSRLSLAVLAGLALAELFSTDLILPPADRALTALGLVLIIWLWSFPAPSRGGDVASILLALLVTTLGVLSLVIWSALPAGTLFNAHWLGLGWELFSALVCLFGLLLLVVRRPSSWGMGFGMLLILLAGHVAEVFLTDANGSYPALVRFSQLVAYPLLFTLSQRMTSMKLESRDNAMPDDQLPLPAVSSLAQRAPADPAFFADLYTISSEKNVSQLYPAIVRVVARTLQGDICLLVMPPAPTGEMEVRAGFNLVRREAIQPTQLKANDVPRLASAIRQKQSIRLLLQNTSVDLLNLGEALNTARTGNLVAAPVTLLDGEGALVLYSPYSEYVWKQEDEEALVRGADSISKLLQGGQQQDSANDTIEQLQMELNMTLVEREKILREKETLAKEIKGLRQAAQDTVHTSGPDEETLTNLQTSNSKALERINALELENVRLSEHVAESTARIEMLSDEKDKLQAMNVQLTGDLEELRNISLSASTPNGQKLIEQLQEENENLRQELRQVETQLNVVMGDAPPTESQLELELRGLLKENARLQKLLGENDVKMFQMERQLQASKSSERWETILNIAQEMRQPMSSVVGYSDFLMSESVGILGALQHKFLDRVKASTERMISMIEELVQIASVEAGHTRLNMGNLDLLRAIDAAISENSTSIREKNISLRMNIPDNLPDIQGDFEAVKLILTNLLQNAGTVTPLEGEIGIQVGYDSYGENQDYVIVQITDSGGGIPSEDLQRVFGESMERVGTKVGNIRGLGGSTLGLAFTKSLVEAHRGRIWVESEFEKGATFSVLLPLSQEVPVSILANWEN